MKRLLYIFIAFFVCVNWACNSDPGFPFGNRPDLEYLDISPREVRAIADSIIIRVEFKDGDGDLGDASNLDNNLVVLDNRFRDTINEPLTLDQATLRYSLPNLTPDTKNPAIQGIITIEVIQTGVRRDSRGIELPVDSTSFDIFVTDRLGNVSDTVTTETILINR